MSKAFRAQYKREISERLRKFGEELYKKGVIRDKKPYEEASNQCLKGPVPSVKGVNIDYANSWGYTLNTVMFTMGQANQPREIKPSDSSVDTIAINAVVIGNYTEDAVVTDPLSYLEFNIITSGKDANKKKMVSSWHLDRDLGNSINTNEMHPLYHFQYGGRNLHLPSGNFEYGSHLVLGTPRIMHFPLDAILGVDFVLSNFFGRKREGLCKMPTYTSPVVEAQKHLWRPYAYALANHWSASFNPNSCSWQSNTVCPQYL
ncbi:hypothetical protein CLV24_11718 [Pontibacter ummariensis]|uniref:Uncharacterized protein n=1 Tax=Pontibacter ummariensis TaxID=1610492 RepID=A0A239IF47_9BACT|nr:hypothetical protein [Pontibacter ummariensis]PRY09814.1 hypothetical protein CLV24_11718 [Pontibacter ummariensis]SNS92052.1 hypothetical protein SAMN06296052_11718 [Pontibacter ummariensis]